MTGNGKDSEIGLLDLGPLTDTVKMGTKDITLNPIDSTGLLYLMETYPEVKMIIEGSQELKDITKERLLTMAPGTISAIIAISVTDVELFKDNLSWREAVGKNAKTLRKIGIHKQIEAITKIFTISLPDGIVPFAELIASVKKSVMQAELDSATLSATVEATQQVEKEQKRKKPEASATASLRQLGAALQTESRTLSRGKVHLDS